MTETHSTALVLFSGGQDSTTCLAWALDRFAAVETIAFDYRQRHAVELVCQAEVRRELCVRFPTWGERLGCHHDMELAMLGAISESALTRDTDITAGANALPSTFVPGRNILFLTVTAAVAYKRCIRHLVGGMCETDFSGYPDCRDDAVKAVQLALNLGMEKNFVIHTPLMWLDKNAIWQLAERLGGGALVELIIEHTHTCYRGDRAHRHEWGYGCADCPACKLRAEGYLRYRAG